MKYIIKKATMNNIRKANELLTRLIIDEKKYDDNINEKCVVREFYERIINDDNSCIYFAIANKTIVGYIYGFIQNNGGTYIDMVAQLDAMYVDIDYRKLGIGNALINEFKKWAKDKGAKYIEVKVCNKNNEAISLYHRNNFHEVKTIMKSSL